MNLQLSNTPNDHDKYDPDVEYFMLDYYDGKQCAHVRMPFLRQEQVFSVLAKLQKKLRRGHHISALRIIPEAFLNESCVNPLIAQEAISAGVKDAEHLLLTTREVLFDRRYESYAKHFQGCDITAPGLSMLQYTP